jgi:hypothetical protein
MNHHGLQGRHGAHEGETETDTCERKELEHFSTSGLRRCLLRFVYSTRLELTSRYRPQLFSLHESGGMSERQPCDNKPKNIASAKPRAVIIGPAKM